MKLCSSVYEALFALSFSFLSKRFSTILELIFTAAVKRDVAPHTRKQRVLAAISKLRSAYFTGYKNKICTDYNWRASEESETLSGLFN